MNTVFVEVSLVSGHTVTINPAQIVAIEPMANQGEQCVVRMPMSQHITDQQTGALTIVPFAYLVSESREALQGRINAAQREAQNEWWAASQQAMGASTS